MKKLWSKIVDGYKRIRFYLRRLHRYTCCFVVSTHMGNGVVGYAEINSNLPICKQLLDEWTKMLMLDDVVTGLLSEGYIIKNIFIYGIYEVKL
jgi:hypothetical protein